MLGENESRSNRTTRLLFVLLLLVAAATTAIVVEAEMNYASAAKADQAVARVTDVQQADDGLQVRLTVENPLNRHLRTQYVVVEVSDGNDLATVGIPYVQRDRLPPGTTQFGVFIAPRYLTSVSLEGELYIGGHIAVEVYNDYEFKVQIRRTEVTP